MTKILLVEDDQSLREIYGIRLVAEGYEIISAGDGEEALAAAVRERPDLIVSDVMMPKISGFDMLDILRSTPETQKIKVIMMTALSSDDQRKRGENLGADRYLVKSQVGIEDVVNVIHEVLGDRGGASTPITQTTPSIQTAPASTQAVSSSQTTPNAQTTSPNPSFQTDPTPTTQPLTQPVAPTGQVTKEQAEHLAGESELEQIVNAQISQFPNPEKAEVAVVTTAPVDDQEAIPAPATTAPQPNNGTANANQPAATE